MENPLILITHTGVTHGSRFKIASTQSHIGVTQASSCFHGQHDDAYTTGLRDRCQVAYCHGLPFHTNITNWGDIKYLIFPDNLLKLALSSEEM